MVGVSAGLGRQRVSVHLTFRQLRQQLIGSFLLLETLVQFPLIVTQLQLAGESSSRAVGGDLVMFEFLRRCDQPCIAKVVAL